MKFKISLLLSITILLINCGSDNKQADFKGSLSDYYYPLSTDKIVYKYESNMGDSITELYEVVWTEFNSDTVIVREIYSKNYDLIITQKYLINNKGVFFQKYISHKRDLNSVQDFSFTIILDKIMLWDISSPKYLIAWSNSYVDYYRERGFVGHDDSFLLHGDSIKTIRFKDDLWRIIDGKKRNKAKRIIEYGMGVGPVVESWVYSNGSKFEKILTEIIEYEDWLNKKNGS